MLDAAPSPEPPEEPPGLAPPDLTGLTRAQREQATWEHKYALLRRFVEVHGRLPKQSETFTGVKIGQWVDSQRAFARRGKLVAGRAERLDEVPHWDWGRRLAPDSVLRLPWETAYRLVVAEMTRTGQVPVATAVVQTPDGPFAIGARCHRRKVAYAHGRLDPDQFVLLDQIPGWEWAQPRLYWMSAYRLLVDWVTEHEELPGREVVVEVPAALVEAERTGGTVRVPAGYEDQTDDGVGPTRIRLGNWWRLQRLSRGRNRLSAHQMRLMEQVPGFTWPATVDGQAALGRAPERRALEAAPTRTPDRPNRATGAPPSETSPPHLRIRERGRA